MNKKNIIWFSCGVTSAVMTYIALKENENCAVYYIETNSEHPDSKRFLNDCQKWFNSPINILSSNVYCNHFDVIKKTKYVNGIAGARCTLELKKKVRYKIEDSIKEWEHQFFGFDSSESLRAKRFMEQNPKAKACFPLIEHGLNKSDCMAILSKNHIEIPVMYKLGFQNNNCIGCVKGGKSYWSLVRKYFPDTFTKMAKIERELDATCIKGFFLDELPLDYPETNPIVPSCNLWCDLDFFK